MSFVLISITFAIFCMCYVYSSIWMVTSIGAGVSVHRLLLPE